MFTEQFCANGEFTYANGKQYQGQFFVVSASREEAICIIADHKVFNYEAAVWFNFEIESARGNLFGMSQDLSTELDAMPLAHYSPEDTIFFVSPDLKVIHLPDPRWIYGRGWAQQWRLLDTKCEYFSKVRELKRIYRNVLEQYPSIRALDVPPRGGLPKRVNLASMPPGFDMEKVPSQVETTFRMPKGMRDDELAMAAFVACFFEEMRSARVYEGFVGQFPYPNLEIVKAEVDFRISNKFTFWPDLYPMDQLGKNEIDRRAKRALKTLQSFEQFGHDHQAIGEAVRRLNDDEICEALLAAYFSMNNGHFFESVKPLMIEASRRIRGSRW